VCFVVCKTISELYHVILTTLFLPVPKSLIEYVLVFYNTLDCINLVVIEKRNLETVKVKLTALLYFTIVHAFVFTHNIICINTYTTILIHDFLILMFDVECVSVYVVPLICHNSEYRSTSQLF
jgi:hypothetical protein